MIPTDPGKFATLVTFRRPTYTTDAAGQKVATWADAGTARVWLRTLTSNEVARNRLAQIETTHEVRCRFRDDVRHDWRIVIADGRTLDIASLIDLDELRRELLIRCVERGPRP